MTGGPGAAPAEAGAVPRRPLAAVLLALLLPVGPAAVALLRYLWPAYRADTPAEVVAAAAAAPGAQSAVLWLGALGMLALVPGVLAAAQLSAAAAPRTTRWALALSVPGYLALGGVVAGDLVVWSAVDAGLPPADAAAVVGAVHGSTVLLVVVFVVGHVGGTVLLGAALLRARAVPAWAGWLLAVSQPVHVVAAVGVRSPELDLAAWSATAVAMAVVAGALLRRTAPASVVPGPSAVPPQRVTRRGDAARAG